MHVRTLGQVNFRTGYVEKTQRIVAGEGPRFVSADYVVGNTGNFADLFRRWAQSTERTNSCHEFLLRSLAAPITYRQHSPCAILPTRMNFRSLLLKTIRSTVVLA